MQDQHLILKWYGYSCCYFRIYNLNNSKSKQAMSDKGEWIASSHEGGYEVTYSSDDISISVVVTDAKHIDNARRSILLGRDRIKECLSKNVDHSKVDLPPISIAH